MTAGSAAPERPKVEPVTAELDVRRLLPLLFRQKWIILGVFAAVVGATVFITLGMPKEYEAATTLEYDPNPPRVLGAEVEDVANPASNFLAGKEWYQTQNTIIASHTIALKVVERLALDRDPDFMLVPKDERAKWRGATRDAAAKRLQALLTVKQERDTRVVRISVHSGDANRAATLANAVADAYMDWVMAERLGSTVRAVEWLSGQLDDVSKRLDTSEHALYDFRRANNVLSVSLADQQNNVTQTISTFSNALTEATEKRIQVEAKLRQLEAAAKADIMNTHTVLVGENPAVTALRTRYHEAVSLRDSLATVYGPNHPEMRRVQASIDTVTAAIRAEILGVVEAVRAEVREARDVEAGLQAAKQQTQNAGLDLNLHEIDYNRLERERANNEKLHGLLLQRTTETNLTRLLRVSPVRLVDRAIGPTAPVSPRPVFNLALGALLGLAAGFGLALMRLRMDRSVSSPEELEALGTTVLGLVPGIFNDTGTPYGGGYYGRRRRQAAPDAGPVSKDLVVHTHPHSSVAECCRTIRTNLAFMSTDKPLHTLVVTSPGPSEGKSTLAISLAITMANSGRRVVLVDTDLRRPRIHSAFRIQSRLGVTSVLAGEHSLRECLQSTVVDGLSLLACGPIPPNPSELLHTARFERLLEDLKEEFDLVILDSPPVGVVIDAAVVGPRVDGAIIVAKAEVTSRDAVAYALRQMRDVGSKVLGCVLNDVDLSRGSYGGYYYYNAGYYRAPEDGGGGDGGDAAGTSPQSSPVA